MGYTLKYQPGELEASERCAGSGAACVSKLKKTNKKQKRLSLFCAVNDTNELGPPQLAEFLANQTTFTLENLNSSMRYKFYLSAKTIKGSGPFLMEEAVTVVNTCRFAAKDPFFFFSW